MTAVISCFLIAGCVTDEGSFWDLKTVHDYNQLNIEFRSDEAQFLRTAAKRNQNKDGWVESSTWQADDDSGESQVWIYIASLYNKAFMKKDIRDMQNLVRRLSGDSYLEFGRQDSFNTDSGELEYIYYSASGQPCVLIRKYWSDPELSADVGQLDATFEWIAGSNFIYAYYCKSSGPDLEKQDLEMLMQGITASDVYWPESMFVSAKKAL